MENSKTKPVKIGYRYGFILLGFGLVMVGINVAMLYFSRNYYPKVLTIGMAISFLSFIFFIFPGGTVAEMPPAREMNREFWSNAPLLHKIIWIVWGIISIAVAFIALISFDPDFYK
jgi:hypothetical protein